MTIRLAPYPEYKDSGLPWLGEIPNHWEVRRGKSVFKCIDVRSRSGDEELLTVSAKDGVVPRREKKVTMFMAESYAGYKLCWPGDLVINSLWAWAGGLGFSRHHGIISSAYGVYRPRPEFASFWPYFDYLLRSKVYDWELHVRSKGIWVSRLQLTDESFLDMPIVLPPNDEAEDLAAFLVAASVRLNRVIRAKRRLIEFLNEQKQAIIHRAVTRGLPSTGSGQATNVRLKSSGVEWLGDVPEHWEVLRVKQCAKTISKGTTPSTEGREILEAGAIRFLKAENINSGDITNKPLCFIDEETHNILKRSQLKENDILFVIAGATLGKTAIVRGIHLSANTNQAVAFVRPNNRALPEYLALWLQSPRIKELIWLNAVQSAQPNLSMTDLGNFLAALPPKNEQRDILEWLEDHLVGINSRIENARREIDLLREYRTRLIADVVTGKLDVRGAELPALDEAEMMEDLDIPEDAEKEEMGDIQEKEI